MPITLNHTIVPSQDKVRAAEFFAKIFGLTYEGSHGHFAPVQVNDTLTLDYDDRDEFDSHHYAFPRLGRGLRQHLWPGEGRGHHLRQRALQQRRHGHQLSPRRPRRLLQRPRRPSNWSL